MVLLGRQLQRVAVKASGRQYRTLASQLVSVPKECWDSPVYMLQYIVLDKACHAKLASMSHPQTFCRPHYDLLLALRAVTAQAI
jgi:hypothetical protein